MRTTFPSGDPRDARIGYSRAVRVANLVFLSGHTGSPAEGEPELIGAADQFRLAISRIADSLALAGATLGDVVRNTVYVSSAVSSPDDLEEIAFAHGDVFAGINPALTIVQVAALPGRALVEVETTAALTN